MIITPAKFEDEMKATKSMTDAVALMLKTLESMGYEAGVSAWFDKFVQDKKQ